jgi:tetratricopeptide (TPR) repeat protein
MTEMTESVIARPQETSHSSSIEDEDAGLREASLALSIAPTAENHLRVARGYARLHILDTAYDHFTAAIRLAPRSAAAYDGRARIWRDWGYTSPALKDVYRAMYFAPRSPEPVNTLGTILLKMGEISAARDAFHKALSLDPRAEYARRNLQQTASVSR